MTLVERLRRWTARGPLGENDALHADLVAAADALEQLTQERDRLLDEIGISYPPRPADRTLANRDEPNSCDCPCGCDVVSRGRCGWCKDGQHKGAASSAEPIDPALLGNTTHATRPNIGGKSPTVLEDVTPQVRNAATEKAYSAKQEGE